MGLRDRLRLLVRPPSRAEPAASRAGAGTAGSTTPRYVEPSGPLPVSIPVRVEAVPPGVSIVDADRVSAAEWPSLRGPVVVISSGDGGARASAVAERIASFGVVGVSWLAGEVA